MCELSDPAELTTGLVELARRVGLDVTSSTIRGQPQERAWAGARFRRTRISLTGSGTWAAVRTFAVGVEEYGATDHALAIDRLHLTKLDGERVGFELEVDDRMLFER